MRQLTEDEAKLVFEKLSVYVGTRISELIGKEYEFVLQKDRVYYVKDAVKRMAPAVGRKQLLSLGTCLGKFTKSGKFRLHVTALPIIAPIAVNRIWVKSNGEMPFLYGNNVIKAHIGRLSEEIAEHSGIVVFNMNDVPLGFGVSARSTQAIRRAQPEAVTVFRQADIGEYLRDEDSLFA